MVDMMACFKCTLENIQTVYLLLWVISLIFIKHFCIRHVAKKCLNKGSCGGQYDILNSWKNHFECHAMGIID